MNFPVTSVAQLSDMEELLNKGLRIQDYHITLLDIIYIAIVFVVIRAVIFGFKYIVRKAGEKRGTDEGVRFTLVKLFSYFFYTIGVVMALQQVGVDVTALMVGSAALLVGLGLGIQQLFSDIVSGFVILFEGIIRVGDIVEIDGIIAKVIRVDIRTSKVVTRKGIYLIVPNSVITSSKVTNWSHADLHSRLDIKIGVAYGTNTKLVEELLIEVAKSHPLVVSDRTPVVVFSDFGDSALMFELRVWATRTWQMDIIMSDIRFKIDEVFRENKIKIPFPQREVYVNQV